MATRVRLRSDGRPSDPRGDGRALAGFWRTADALRPLGLLYGIHQFVERLPEVAHPCRGWVVLSALAAWTLISFVVRARPRWWLALDLAVATGAILATRLVDSPEVIASGSPTLPGLWPSAAVLSWAIVAGPGGGIGAAGVVAVADLLLVRVPTEATLHNIVILLLLGGLAGYGARLSLEADRATREAAEIRARTSERERLARDVHDGVLQALAYIHRRGLEIGGDAGDLGRLAAEQERRLRDLVRERVEGSESDPRDTTVDLTRLVTARAADAVTVVGTGPLPLAADRADEIDAAVGAALDNVVRHAGPDARAWVLLEREGDDVVVLVRDDGPGIPAGRLEEARRAGRLGVASSIVGRLHDLGGEATITSTGHGTRVRLRAPIAPRQEDPA